MKLVSGIAIFFLGGLSFGATPSISEVAKSKTWLRLMHFDESKKISGFINPKYFFSSKGRSNPEEELRATLAYLQSESLNTPEEKRFACLFPARRRFIEKNLNIVPHLDCPILKEWFKLHSPNSISFIFSSQFLGNPASIFGHSFLRFDSDRRSNLLGTAFSYFAKSQPADSGLSYAFKGLFGGYSGIYQLDAFYPKNHLYGSLENRDLWEYKLRLTHDEVVFIFEHAYELSYLGQEPYYFLDRNCSAVLLELIDLGRESSNLARDAGGIFVTPQQAIKILSNHHLIQQERFRPSQRRMASAQYQTLNSKQKKTVRDIISGDKEISETEDSQVLSSLTSFLSMKDLQGELSLEQQDILHNSSQARSLLPVDSRANDKLLTENRNRGPMYGHDISQAHVGIAQTDKTTAFQIGIRPVGHALEDLSVGLLPNTQILVMDTILRIEEVHRRPLLRIRKLSLIDVVSLQAFDLVNDQKSWSAQLAYIPTLGSKCVDCRALRIGGLIGYATQLKRFLGYSLVGLNFDLLRPEEKVDYRLGPALTLGLVSQFDHSFFIKFENRLEYFNLGHYINETILATDVSANWQLKQNSSLGLSFLLAANLRQQNLNSKDTVLRYSKHF